MCVEKPRTYNEGNRCISASWELNGLQSEYLPVTVVDVWLDITQDKCLLVVCFSVTTLKGNE